MKLLINILIIISIKHLRICEIILVIKQKEGRQGKNEFLSKETVKKAISGYGMIISVTLQRILKIYSNDNLE